jgi:hypothetical protein
MYRLIKPEKFSLEHINYIENFKQMIKMLSINTDVIMGAKDINSRHIVSTNEYARIVGLKKDADVADRLDKEMPCEGTVQYADQFVQEDRLLMESKDIKKGLSILNIHNYSDGTKARIFKKYMLKHEQSESILGTIYAGYDVNLTDVLNIIPNYIIRFGATGSIEAINNNTKIVNNTTLTNYEQEICFLLLLNWSFKQIADFMNFFRPIKTQRTMDTIIKKKNYICQKLGLASTILSNLQEFLVSINFHNKMPASFFKIVIGSNPLREISV